MDDNFKMAAQSLTSLFKQAQNAYMVGYADRTREIIDFLESHNHDGALLLTHLKSTCAGAGRKRGRWSDEE